MQEHSDIFFALRPDSMEETAFPSPAVVRSEPIPPAAFKDTNVPGRKVLKKTRSIVLNDRPLRDAERSDLSP